MEETSPGEALDAMTIAKEAASGRLTTHVLDTMSGEPGAGIAVELFRLDGEQKRRLARVTTNADGRSAAPLLQGPELQPGIYELLFHVGDYFRGRAVLPSEPAFLDLVPIRFGIADAARHYHVPLLISPFGYSTYRGS
jgi:5-hydroxyisourate hydrolase